MKLAKILIERPLFAWLIILTALIGGIVGYFNIGRLEDPDFTIKTALVLTPYPGASSIEVEQEVTDRLESAIQQMSQLDRIDSRSQPGLSEVRVMIRDEYNSTALQQVWDELRRKVNDAATSLPPGAGPSRVVDNFGDVYGMFYALTGKGYSYAQLDKYARDIRKQLLKLDDVADVIIAGQQQEQIIVEIDQAALSAKNLSLAQITNILNIQNEVRPAGREKVGDILLRITPTGALNSVEAVRSLPLTTASGHLLLGDIAKVSRDYVLIPDQIIRLNGEPALTIGISTRSNVNVVAVGAKVHALLDDLAKTRPQGMQLTTLYDQPNIVEKSVNGFVMDVIISISIVAIALCIGLGWRAGAILTIELFLSILGTIAVMYILGVELERISLGALVIVMGMLTDNTIVVCEGMLVRVSQGMDHLQAAQEILKKSIWILLGSTIVGIFAFSGIGLSPDSVGEFCFSLFMVASISLLMSWVIAIALTPLLGTYFLRRPEQPMQSIFDRPLYKQYGAFLGKVIKKRGLVVSALFAITVFSFWCFRFVPQSFFPASETPMFYVNMHMPMGTDINTVARNASDIEKILLAKPEVEHVSSFIGAGATRFFLVYDPHSRDSAYAQFIVQVKNSDKIGDMLPKIRHELEQKHPYARWVVTRPMFGPGGGSAIQIRINGDDPVILRQLSEKIQSILRNSGLVVSINDDWESPISSLQPEFDEGQARALGVSRQQVSNTMAYASEGLPVGIYREDDQLYPIILRAPKTETDVQRLMDLQVYSDALQNYVPMTSVISQMTLTPEEGRIIRRERVRVLTISGNPQEGLNTMSVFNQIKPAIEAIPLPPGYSLEWGGEYESSKNATESLFRQLPLGFLGMILVILLMFGRLKPALIVLLIVPMSICGVTIGLLTFNGAFGFVALLGLLSLFGMLIKNAVMVVEEIDDQISQGVIPYQAVIKGSMVRLRPVFLAAITTILGMIPLLWDPFFTDMAITMMSGLAFATILTLVAIPALYALFFSVKEIKQ